MEKKSFKERLNSGATLVGTLSTLPCPELMELLAGLGFDWLFLDAEHSAMDTQTVQRLLQASGGRTPVVVRVPGHDPVWIKKVLDMGPAGIILPMVNSGQEAKELAKACLYPPEGERSVGLARVHGYGMRFAEALANANRETALIFQIEHRLAVENAEAVLETPGLDAVFVGPYDLSASMGIPGQVDRPEVVEAIDRVKAAADKQGKAVGIFGASPEAVAPWIQKGFTLIAAGTEALFTAAGSLQALGALRKTVSEK